MAIRYAMINEEGEIASVLQPGYRHMYADRSHVDGFFVVHVDDWTNLEDTSVWNFDEAKFETRDSAPTKFHKWKDKKWELRSDDLYQEFRRRRTAKLRNSDWTMLEDAPLNDAQKELWRRYRQNLRDLVADFPNLENIDDVAWPKAPGE